MGHIKADIDKYVKKTGIVIASNIRSLDYLRGIREIAPKKGRNNE